MAPPRKRKSLLKRQQENRERQQRRREMESTSKRESRLEENSERYQRRIETESTSDRESRMEENRKRYQRRRETESTPDRELRLKENRERQQGRIEAESTSDRESRTEENIERYQRRIETESTPDRALRLEENRERYQRIMETESTPDRESRLEENRARQQIKRITENTPDREARLEANRERYHIRIETESTPDRESRLEENRESQQRRRIIENTPDRESRLEVNRERQQRRIETESILDRVSRMEHNREVQRRARETELTPQRNLRLEQNREMQQRRRQLESTSDEELRLQQVRITVSNVRRSIWTTLENAAYNYDPSEDYSSNPLCLIGSMSITCEHCEAKKWKGEAPGMCCSGGKVHLTSLIDPPEPIRTLVIGDSTESKHFLQNIRLYNSCFQMTSFGTTKEIREQGFMPTFKVQGQVYHRIGSPRNLPNEDPKFLQVYFVGDTTQQAEYRCRNVPQIRQDIVLQLQNMLNSENSYVHSFKSAMEKIGPECKLVIFADKTPQGEHERRFNVPTTAEVAVLMAGEQCGSRDVVLEERSGTIKRISDTHRSYDALQYPLIFWQGEDGYNFLLRQRNPNTGELRKISAMDFYAYRMMMRCSSFNILLRSRALFQQFIVDMYAKIESERLRYIQLNQRALREEQYAHLRDAVINDGNVTDVGQLVILPSSFTGGPRYMHERTQDAMTYVRNYGRPDHFITFTCNPKWTEIQQELFDGQKSTDRHDLLARVFHQKHKTLMNLINKSKIFGEVRCHMYTIEWQKRGLPHAHILVWLRDNLHVHRIDSFISAEIPNPENDPKLFSTVTNQMVHGPCGNRNPRSPCMKDGICTKRFPRRFLKETQTGHDGYPLYRRRSPQDGGFTSTLNVRGTEMTVDNTWIVPYCPLLSKILNAHINVEFCNSVKSIKYVCKYVNKGSDMAVFDVTSGSNDHNEIHQYEMGRYISSNEAAWRILSFPIHERYLTVTHLSVHLENGQRVYFTSENAAERAQDPQQTTLTSFFRLCREDIFARTLLYNQIPQYYTWNSSRKIWNRRRQGEIVPGQTGIKSSDALGRVYTVHPNNSECFHLRLLLHEVRGPTSFEDLRTVDGRVCISYKEACQVRGLLENDNHWNTALEEAAASRSPNTLRNLFAVMLQTCFMSNPNQLWMSHRESLSEDILHQARIQQQNMDLHYSEDIFNRALLYIEDVIISLGGSSVQNFELPATIRNEDLAIPSEVYAERNYNTNLLTSYIEENEPKMVQDQKEAFDKITRAVFNRQGGIFFLDAPGGTGKTFLINLLLAKVRQRKEIALAVASSGIAATLLTGGRTAHSAFKLPLNLTRTETPTCNISRNSGKAKVLQECKLIVWDECTMSHKAAFEAMDVTLKDLRHNDSKMGGITMVLAGDFRQTLPVVPRGTRADEMQACIKSSYIWNNIERLGLSTNMRVYLNGDPSAQQFADDLLKLGNGAVTSNTEDGHVGMQNIGTIVATQEELIEAVFPNVTHHFTEHAWLCQRAILAPRNETVNIINSQLLQKLPGDLQVYKSIDTTCDSNETIIYTTEFLNTLDPPGVPSHIVELKVGAPIMLLRNLNPPSLCNGTRLTVRKLMPNIIEAIIITGQAAGEVVFIPRIPIIPTDLPFEFKRLQFPIRLSFAMSINKAQGQSLKVVGLDLRKPCFSHGQLYVGCSRVGHGKNLYILAPNGRTLNIVYPEAL